MPRHAVNGIQINLESVGVGPNLLMLHGFTGSIEAWQGIPERLGRCFTVHVLDVIGHGKTSAPDNPERYRIRFAVEDIRTLLGQIGIERVSLLGYSMGGRLALRFSLAYPERISALVIESASPGISNPDARLERVKSDELLAMKIERDGVESFVDYWESLPLFESQRDLLDGVRRRQRELRLKQSAIGLANSLRGMGAGAMDPVSEHLDEFQMPVLYLAGEYDEKYRKIGRRMVAEMPDARFQEIAGAGHTIHLEQPEEYVQAVTGFLDELQRRAEE